MHSLEDWIKQLLTRPLAELNRKYDYRGTAEQEVQSFADAGPRSYRSAYVSAETLRGLHEKIRGQKCESSIWNAIIFHLRDSLPTSIAHDLIDRNIIVSQMGHTRQNDEIQRRLAFSVDEALLTLVGEMFTKPTYTVTDLENLLSQHPINGWLLEKWEHWALLDSQVKDRDKEAVFHSWAWRHPQDVSGPSRRIVDVPSPERYLEIMADKARERARIEREAEEEQLRAEQAVEARRLEMQRLSEKDLTPEEIEQIFSTQAPDELLAVARNPRLPVEWLQKLINCYGIKGARQIREAVQKNLSTQSPQHE